MSGYSRVLPAGARADKTEVEVKAAGAFAAVYAFSSSIAMEGYSAIDVTIKVTAIGTNATMSIKMQTSGEATPVNWSDVLSDDNISNGATNPNPYIASFTLAGATEQTLTFPRRKRWMRVAILGTAADGSYSITMMRR